MKLKRARPYITWSAFAAYFAFLAYSWRAGFAPGLAIAHHFYDFFLIMLKLLPCAFLLVALFDVWVSREHVERHLGDSSGPLAYLWMILLGGTTVGGLYVAFPLAYSLLHKGAKLSLVLTYLGAAAICRIPMTLFEASFLGLKFTLLRLAASLPLLVLSSLWLGAFFEKRRYRPPLRP